MYKLIIYTSLPKNILYSLLIQFSPIKNIFFNKYYTVLYNTKKDIKYTVEMLEEIKINNKYIRYKVVEKGVRIRTEWGEIFDKFRVSRRGNEVTFEDEERMREVLEIVEKNRVNYTKLNYEILE
ncbi:hypothetical protein P3W45_000723 [Vairimorpha bombi]|jgi:hypothetical protein